MKVGTDGVLLGSWVRIGNSTSILDIGTGTCLLALMLAQRSAKTTTIDAIDIDNDAIMDAKLNVARSPWFDRINVIKSSLQEFGTGGYGSKYELVVSNPPYFESIDSGNIQRSMARQNNTLNYYDLVHRSAELLSNDGEVAFIIPISFEVQFEELLREKNLYTKRECLVRPTLKKSPIRKLIQASKRKVRSEKSEIVLEPHQRHLYSDEFLRLIAPYYL